MNRIVWNRSRKIYIKRYISVPNSLKLNKKKKKGKVICPFDKTHVIRVERFPCHVRKCTKSNPTTAKKLEKCIYVNCHRFLKGQGKEHYEECEGRIYSEGSTRPVKSKSDTSLPQYKDLEIEGENWEDEVNEMVSN